MADHPGKYRHVAFDDCVIVGRLPSLPQARTVHEYEAGTIKLRGDVVEMIAHYASGQREVLQDLL